MKGQTREAIDLFFLSEPGVFPIQQMRAVPMSVERSLHFDCWTAFLVLAAVDTFSKSVESREDATVMG